MPPAFVWCSGVRTIAAARTWNRPNAASEKIALQIGCCRLSRCYPSHRAQSRVPDCLPLPEGAYVKNCQGYERRQKIGRRLWRMDWPCAPWFEPDGARCCWERGDRACNGLMPALPKTIVAEPSAALRRLSLDCPCHALTVVLRPFSKALPGGRSEPRASYHGVGGAGQTCGPSRRSAARRQG